MGASRVQEKFVKRARIQRNWAPFEMQWRCVCADQPFWDNRNEIGARHRVQRLQVVRDGDGNISLPSFCLQPDVDGVLPRTSHPHGNVPGFEKRVFISEPIGSRVSTAKDTHVAVGKETPPVKARKGLGHTGDRCLDVPCQLGRTCSRLGHE